MTIDKSHKKVQRLIRQAMVATSVAAIGGVIMVPQARAVTANNTTVTIDATNTINGAVSLDGGNTLLEDEGVSAINSGSITMTGSTVTVDQILDPNGVGNAKFYPHSSDPLNWNNVKYAGVTAKGTGSTVTGDDVTINITNSTNGLVTALNGGTVEISNSNITGNLANDESMAYYYGFTSTTGVGIQTVLSQDANSNVILNNTNITTYGYDHNYHSASITAQLEGTVTLGGNITVNSHGDKTYGVTAEGYTTGGTVTTDPNNPLTLVVTTDGDNSPGIYAGNGGTSANVTVFSSIDLDGTNRDNSSVTTTGTNSDGVQIDNGASVTLHNITVNANGPDSSAVHFTGDQSGTFTGDTVTLNGNITSSETGTNTAKLQNNSIFNGAATTDGSSTLALELQDSTWNLNGNSTIKDLTNYGSHIIFDSNTPFKTLTTTNYSGTNNSSIVLNTQLGDDNSPTDQLIIDGGSATGTTSLNINSTGSGGAPTTGNGIALVDAINGGTTDVNAFSLQNTLSSGILNYDLYRGGLTPDATTDNDWFLRSSYSDAAVATAATPAISWQIVLSMLPQLHDRFAYVDGLIPQEPSDKDERSQASLNPQVKTQNVALYNNSTTPSLQNALYNPNNQQAQFQKVALAERSSLQSQQQPPRRGVWARLLGQNLKFQSHDDAGSGFDGNIWGLQAGLDFYAKVKDNGTRQYAGAYLANASSDGDVLNNTGRIGSLDLDATSLGLYYTKYSPEGWYLDGVAQYSWLRNIKARTGSETIEPNGSSYTLSLEAGKQLYRDRSIILEPQAQLIYSHNSLDDVTLSDDTVIHIANLNAVTGRFGARVFPNPNRGNKLMPWASANVWHTFSNNSKISSSGVDLQTPIGGTVGELAAGLSTRPGNDGRGWSFNASLGYLFNLSGADYSGLKGSLGLRKNW